MERLIGGMLGGDGGGAGFPPTSGGGGDEPASPDEFFAFLQQYTAMGGSLDPDEAPPARPRAQGARGGSGGVGALRGLLAMQPPRRRRPRAAGRPSPGLRAPPAARRRRPRGDLARARLRRQDHRRRRSQDFHQRVRPRQNPSPGHGSGPAARCPSTWSTRWRTSRTRTRCSSFGSRSACPRASSTKQVSRAPPTMPCSTTTSSSKPWRIASSRCSSWSSACSGSDRSIRSSSTPSINSRTGDT